MCLNAKKRFFRFLVLVLLSFLIVFVLKNSFLKTTKLVAKSLQLLTSNQSFNNDDHPIFHGQPGSIQIDRNPNEHLVDCSEEHLSEKITIVSAYFDLGRFKKGYGNTYFATATYLKWANVFEYLDNPLVVYTDSLQFLDLMQLLRSEYLNKTKIIMIERTSSWAFQNEKRIAEIYSTARYPKHYPNTVVPAYACAQHAKYDVTARAAKANFFKTKYISWLDVGYFRDKVDAFKHFRLTTPRAMDDSRLAMNLVWRRPMSSKPDDIFKKNIVWVGGGLFLGCRRLIVQYEQQFKRAVNYFLSQNLMNTDQQVTFAMFSDEGRQVIKPKIQLQTYKSPGGVSWFYLGESMIDGHGAK